MLRKPRISDWGTFSLAVTAVNCGLESGAFGQEGAGSANAPALDVALPLEPGSSSLLEMVFAGNALGVAIVCLLLLLSLVSAYFILEQCFSITRQRLMPEKVMEELAQLVEAGEIKQAVEFCQVKENYSLATEVVLAGLVRYQSSEFGFAEYRSAVEEAGEDLTGRLYRRTEVLHVIGAISPMLGLTGTVLGMIEAFTTMATTNGVAPGQELAGGIGQALLTTLLGLLVAIPTMVAYSYFRNRIDSIVAEAGKRVERVLMPLGRRRTLA